MALAKLSIELEAKLANFEAGMDKAVHLAEKNAQATAAAWSRAGSIVAGLGGIITGAFAGFSTVDFVRGNVDAIDALNDVADATGASIENISALDDLARRTGTTLDVVTTSLIKLNGGLSDAKPDSPVALALNSIGLEVDKLKALDPAEALRVIAVALSGYADDGNKARITQELFGKSVREVGALLKDLGEQTSLVGKLTKEQTDEAEKFNKQLLALQANVTDVTRSLTSELVPALNGVFDSIKKNGGVWAAFMDTLGADWDKHRATAMAEELQTVRGQLEAFLAIPESARKPWQVALIADLRKEVAELARETTAASAAVNARANDPPSREPQPLDFLPLFVIEGDKKRDSKQVEKISEAQRALAKYVTEMEREAEKLAELTDKQKLLNALRLLPKDNGVGPGMREYLEGLERQITLGKLRITVGLQDAAIRADELRITKEQAAAEKTLADELYRISGRADTDRRSALMGQLLKQQDAGEKFSSEELDKILNEITGKAEKTLADELYRISGRADTDRRSALMGQLLKQQDAGEKFSSEELDKILDEITGKLKPKLEEMDELTKQFARNVQDSLGDTLKRTLKGDFDSIGDLWANLLIDMAAEAAAAQLGKEIFGADFFKGGDLGGIAKTALTFFGFAHGGDHAGGLRLVGENGPELEVTGPSRIFNTQQTQQLLRGGGGGGSGTARTVNVTYAPVFNVDSRSDRAQVLADMDATSRHHQAEFAKFLRAKGVL